MDDPAKLQLILESFKNPPKIDHPQIRRRREEINALIKYLTSNGGSAPLDELTNKYGLSRMHTPRKIKEYITQLEKAEILSWDRNTDIISIPRRILEAIRKLGLG